MTSETEKHGLVGWMAANPVAANLLMLVFLLGGFAMIPHIRQEVFPEFDLDIVNVSVAYPGASPEDVEEGILLVVEEAIRGVDGVKLITSKANEGVGVVSAELLLDADGNEVLADIKSAVDRIVTFPLDAERPVVQLVRSRSRVLTILIHGDLPPAALKHLGETARDELLLSEAISTVDLLGLPPVEIAIEIPQDVLRAHGLTSGSVAQRLASASLDMAGGGIKTDAGEVLLRLNDRLDDGNAFAMETILASRDGVNRRLSELGTVTDGFADTDQELFFNGRRAVGLDVYRVGPEKPLDISAASRAFVEQYRQQLPKGVDALVVSDRSDLYRERVNLLLRNALLGLALVMIILGLFLEIRLAFWVMMGIPVSFLGSLLLLPYADVSINMISLFAFIITLGIVVDDAVVVGENVYHLREQGKSRLTAAVLGTREMAVPVILSILTNIAAVLPLLFVPGVQGKIWRNVPIIMVLVFSISLVEALFILPAHLAHQKLNDNRGVWRFLDWPERSFGRAMHWFINRLYAPAVRATLRYRYLTVAIGTAALILTVGYMRSGRMRFTFFPQVESDRVTASAVLPYGAPLAASREVSDRIQKAALDLILDYGGDKAAIGVQTSLGSEDSGGGGPMAGPIASGSHLVGATVYLEPLDKRGFSAKEFTDRWRQAVGRVPGLESLTFKFSIGPASRMPVDVQLSHRDPLVIEKAALDVAEALRSFDGVFEIDDGVAHGKPQIEYHLTGQGQAVGLTSQEVGRQVRAAFYGAEVTRQQRGRDELRIMVRLPRTERISEAALDTLMLRTPSGGEIAFTDAVSVTRGRAYDVIRRDQGRRVLSVTADVDLKRTSAGEVLEALSAKVMPAITERYPGLSYSFEGEQRDQRDSFRALGVGFAAAVFVIFALLAVPFKSYLQGLIVLSAVPFGFVGAILGHMLMGYNLSFVSVMGIVALSGVVVNDNLILVDTMNRLRADGMPLAKAASEGPIRRFRPVLLTSMTTFFGLAPMIFEKSVQARFMIPMALSLGFGILYTTLIALVLVPSLYLIVERAKER
jgi:multidrug efflux pump subunit AcrB